MLVEKKAALSTAETVKFQVNGYESQNPLTVSLNAKAQESLYQMIVDDCLFKFSTRDIFMVSEMVGALTNHIIEHQDKLPPLIIDSEMKESFLRLRHIYDFFMYMDIECEG